MIDDDEMVMMSALQHYLFCRRQCALIHIEQVWSENYLTASGRQMHERVDRTGGETRRDVHVATALRLVSRRLGLIGVADLVEFHLVADERDAAGMKRGAKLLGRPGWWQPYPVEYKRGEPKAHRADEVQLCGQALCLEEMLGVHISEGALFYGEIRRRQRVEFDELLRRLVEETVGGVRKLLASGETPPPVLMKGCRACSLVEVCRPRELDGQISARLWISCQLEKVDR